MAAVTAQMVKALREKTGAGMMDCKKALGETEGDIEEAVDWLRTKGLSAAAKKAGRVAAEGVVAVVTSGGSGAMVEVNSETDFVARNDEFQGFAASLASMALKTGNDLEVIKATPFPGTGRTVEEQLVHNIATIGENMSLRRAIRLDVEGGVVVPYMHNAVVPGIGKIGVLVALKSSADVAVLERLGKQLAMHVAATAPQSMSVNDLDPTTVEREKTILTDQAKATGRPDNIIEKMVEGRLRKFYQEVVLLEQTFVVDNETKVATVIENAATEAGTPIELVGFERFTLGEGIEREEKDFAAEVAATLEN
jgi:elongation factor Ts